MKNNLNISFLQRKGLSDWKGADEMVLELAKIYNEEPHNENKPVFLSQNDAKKLILSKTNEEENDEKEKELIEKRKWLAEFSRQHDEKMPHWWLYKTAGDYIKMRSFLMLQAVSTSTISLKEYLNYHKEHFLSDKDVQDVSSFVTFSGGNLSAGNDILLLFDVAQSEGSTDAEKAVAAQSLVETANADVNATIDLLLSNASQEKMVDALEYIVREAQKKDASENIGKAVIKNFELRLSANADDNVKLAIARIAKFVPTEESHVLLKKLVESESNGHILTYATHALAEQFDNMRRLSNSPQSGWLARMEKDIAELLGKTIFKRDSGTSFLEDPKDGTLIRHEDIDGLNFKRTSVERQVMAYVLGENDLATAELSALINGDPDRHVKHAAMEGLTGLYTRFVRNNKWWPAGLHYVTFKQMEKVVPDEQITFDDLRKRLDGLNQAIFAYDHVVGLDNLINSLNSATISRFFPAKGLKEEIKRFLETSTSQWNELDKLLKENLAQFYRIKSKLSGLTDKRANADEYEKVLSDLDMTQAIGEDPKFYKMTDFILPPSGGYPDPSELSMNIGLPAYIIAEIGNEVLNEDESDIETAATKMADRISGIKWEQVKEFLRSMKTTADKAAAVLKGMDSSMVQSVFLSHAMERLSTYGRDADLAANDLCLLVSDGSCGKIMSLKFADFLRSLNDTWNMADKFKLAYDVRMTAPEFISEIGVVAVEAINSNTDPQATLEDKLDFTSKDMMLRAWRQQTDSEILFPKGKSIQPYAEEKIFEPIWIYDDKTKIEIMAQDFLERLKPLYLISSAVNKPEEIQEQSRLCKLLMQYKFKPEEMAKVLSDLACNSGKNCDKTRYEEIKAKMLEFTEKVQRLQNERLAESAGVYLTKVNSVIRKYEEFAMLVKERNWDKAAENLSRSGLACSQIEKLMSAGPYEHPNSYVNILYGGFEPDEIDPQSQQEEVTTEAGTAKSDIELLIDEGVVKRKTAKKKKIVDDSLSVFDMEKWRSEDMRRAKLVLGLISKEILKGLHVRDKAFYDSVAELKIARTLLPVEFAGDKSFIFRMNRSFSLAANFETSDRYEDLDDLHKSFYNLLRKHSTCIGMIHVIENEIAEKGEALFDAYAEKFFDLEKIGKSEYEDPKWKQNFQPALKDKKYSQKDVAAKLLQLIAAADIKALTSVPEIMERIEDFGREKIAELERTGGTR